MILFASNGQGVLIYFRWPTHGLAARLTIRTENIARPIIFCLSLDTRPHIFVPPSFLSFSLSKNSSPNYYHNFLFSFSVGPSLISYKYLSTYATFHNAKMKTSSFLRSAENWNNYFVDFSRMRKSNKCVTSQGNNTIPD